MRGSHQPPVVARRRQAARLPVMTGTVPSPPALPRGLAPALATTGLSSSAAAAHAMLVADVARRNPTAGDAATLDALKRGITPKPHLISTPGDDDPAASPAEADEPAPLPQAPAPAAAPLPPSRIPASFHVRDEAGRLIFPSERPAGDAEVGLLADTLGGMLEEWRTRLDANKPSFPLGAARWGVLQMCLYDMWCTIEEARIWDIGLTEAERLTHFYSPPLAAMLGRLRVRLSQAFATTLSMSQRMQFELQRWHTQWVEQSEQLRREEGTRQSLQTQVTQLQERVTSLEDELTLHAARTGDPHPLEKAFQKLQEERTKLSQQLRAANARNTSVRTSNLTLKLSNEGLLEELARWRASLGDDPAVSKPGPKESTMEMGGRTGPPPQATAAPPDAPAAAAVSMQPGGEGGGAEQLAPLIELFSSYPADAQRVALDAIMRVHEALTGEASSPPRAPANASGSVSVPPPPPRAGSSERLGALEQLAATLSDEEADFLTQRIAQRRSGDAHKPIVS